MKTILIASSVTFVVFKERRYWNCYVSGYSKIAPLTVTLQRINASHLLWQVRLTRGDFFQHSLHNRNGKEPT